MLSDWLEIPNLYQRSGQQLKYWMERYLFGVKKAMDPSRGNREATWLGVYAVLSGIYRIIVFGGILLFVADRFFDFRHFNGVRVRHFVGACADRALY